MVFHFQDDANHKAKLEFADTDALKRFKELGNSLSIDKYRVTSPPLTTFHVDLRTSSTMNVSDVIYSPPSCC